MRMRAAFWAGALARACANRPSITVSETSFAMCSICRCWCVGQICVAFWPVKRQNFPGYKVNHGLGDIRRMIADPFDVFGDEQEMSGNAGVAENLNREGQKVGEDRLMEQIEVLVCGPHALCAFGITLG